MQKYFDRRIMRCLIAKHETKINLKKVDFKDFSETKLTPKTNK